ncbi:hypothetical protein B0F90DRAFT_1912426 [Multifurca ochricompacta]|uniref:LIM zinc-binding domain-containing protein n=1 Tax=Multifurca ochricompacta TaxID=376703 RepID=A0AAD4M1T3_9AGAM|nr:hypothetical protein B0F90DRAFT_1912426 [Multifurca ochricompacta]
MHPFGGTPVCPRCSKAVYAAEQVMGPGRKLYHKPCLTCASCGVRLDSFRLLEHDEEPYCKNCHSKNFGTRDLRQANLPHKAGDPTLSPSRATGPSTSSPQNPVTSPAILPSGPFPPPQAMRRKGPFFLQPPLLRPTRVLSPTRGAFSADLEQSEAPTTLRRKEATTTLYAIPSSPTRRPTSSSDAPATLGRALSLSANEATGTRRINPLTASTTGTRYGAALTGELRATPTGGAARQWGSGTPQCPRCNKSVYFAEQVKAIGKTWHKACLRCSECGTSLDSSRLTEKDGDPLCHRCYNKLHGPAGSGYALLGKAGG